MRAATLARSCEGPHEPSIPLVQVLTDWRTLRAQNCCKARVAHHPFTAPKKMAHHSRARGSPRHPREPKGSDPSVAKSPRPKGPIQRAVCGNRKNASTRTHQARATLRGPTRGRRNSKAPRTEDRRARTSLRNRLAGIGWGWGTCRRNPFEQTGT